MTNTTYGSITITNVSDGQTFYTWYIYADDANGTNATLDSVDKEYMGVASNQATPLTQTILDTLTDFSIFSWSQISIKVTSQTEQYYKTDSKDTPSSNDTDWLNETAWVTTMPNPWKGSSGTKYYVWKRQKTFWSNDTVTYVGLQLLSDYDVATSLAKQVGMEVGAWCKENNITIIDGATIMTGTIHADKIEASTIGADKLSTDAITSRNYYKKDAEGKYTTELSGEGAKLNLADGTWDSANFKIGTDGSITATKGTIGGLTITGISSTITKTSEDAQSARDAATSAATSVEQTEVLVGQIKDSVSSSENSARSALEEAQKAAASAGEASASAGSAATDAAIARTDADNALASAGKAEAEALSAAGSAEIAQGEATKAATSANAADQRATQAETQAAQANTNAASAVETANSANAQSASAVQTAQSANETATAANTSATEAKQAANNAVGTANEAKNIADAAVPKVATGDYSWTFDTSNGIIMKSGETEVFRVGQKNDESGLYMVGNGEFTGKITANDGDIGSWIIGEDSLTTGNFGADESVHLYTKGYTTDDASTDKKYFGQDEDKTWMFTIGSNFGVDSSGNLYATGGKIGGLTITKIEGTIKQTSADAKAAKDNAQTATEQAEAAARSASDATTSAGAAQAAAESANASVLATQGSVQAAQASASAAADSAIVAQGEAEQAKKDAATAQEEATKAATSAGEAQTLASQADTKSGQAVDAANTANTTANTAKSTADVAKSAAESAQSVAAAAQAKADAAVPKKVETGDYNWIFDTETGIVMTSHGTEVFHVGQKDGVSGLYMKGNGEFSGHIQATSGSFANQAESSLVNKSLVTHENLVAQDYYPLYRIAKTSEMMNGETKVSFNDLPIGTKFVLSYKFQTKLGTSPTVGGSLIGMEIKSCEIDGTARLASSYSSAGLEVSGETEHTVVLELEVTGEGAAIGINVAGTIDSETKGFAYELWDIKIEEGAGVNGDYSWSFSPEEGMQMWNGPVSATPVLKVDSEGLHIKGSGEFTGKVTANDGAIGGWSISETKITSADDNLILDSSGQAQIDSEKSSLVIKAGDKFGVTSAGKIYATDADISGTVRSSTIIGSTFKNDSDTFKIDNDGNISGAIITGSSIEVKDGDMVNFSVNKKGELMAKDADIIGKITAEEGKIGNWLIAKNTLELKDDKGTVVLDPHGMAQIPGKATNLVFKAGNNFGVTKEGKLYATEADISGKIVATEGSFSGHIDAASGSFSGHIEADSGKIGGFGIGENKLTAGNGDGFVGIQTTKYSLGHASAEYIESSGAQYINTGICSANNVAIEVDVKLMSPRSAYGSTTGYNYTANETKSYFYYSSDRTQGGFADYKQVREIVKQDGNKCYRNGELVHTFTEVTNFNDKWPIYLFGRNAGGALNDYGQVQIYGCKIWQDGNLVRNFEPAYKDGEYCLYETCFGQYYKNNGTGTFNGKLKTDAESIITDDSGNIYRVLEYIESSGSQYIETEVVPTNNMFSEIVFTPTTGGLTENAIFGSSWTANGYFLMLYQGKVRWHSGGKSVDVGPFNAGDKLTCQCSNSYIYVNGTRYDISGGANTTNTIELLGTMDYSGSSGRGGIGRIESFKIWDDSGTIIRNYIPVIKNEIEYGLYDQVNKKFYGNSGSGAFSGKGIANEFASIYLGSANPEEAPFSVTNTGKLKAESGTIAGWTIDSNKLTSGTIGEDGSFGVFPKGIIGGLNSTADKTLASGDAWVMTAGSKFGVTKNGALYATNANISGKINAGEGAIAGWEIQNDPNKGKTPAIFYGAFGSPESFHMYAGDKEGTLYRIDSNGNDIFRVWRDNWRLTIGSNFGVTSDGEIYAYKGSLAGIGISGDNLTWSNEKGELVSLISGTLRQGTARSVGSSGEKNDWFLWTDSKFGVDAAGKLYATGADVSGKITATSGKIGSVEIDNLATPRRNLVRYSREQAIPQVPGYTDGNANIHLTLVNGDSTLSKGKTYYFSSEISLTSHDSSYTLPSQVSIIVYNVTGSSYNAILHEKMSIVNGKIAGPLVIPDNKGEPHKILVYAGVAQQTQYISGVLKNIKLEEGASATIWTEAPEDIMQTENSGDYSWKFSPTEGLFMWNGAQGEITESTPTGGAVLAVYNDNGTHKLSVKGHIEAESGTVGGWSIGDTLSKTSTNGSVSIQLAARTDGTIFEVVNSSILNPNSSGTIKVREAVDNRSGNTYTYTGSDVVIQTIVLSSLSGGQIANINNGTTILSSSDWTEVVNDSQTRTYTLKQNYNFKNGTVITYTSSLPDQTALTLILAQTNFTVFKLASSGSAYFSDVELADYTSLNRTLRNIDTKLNNLGFKGPYDISIKNTVVGKVAQLGTIVYGYLLPNLLDGAPGTIFKEGDTFTIGGSLLGPAADQQFTWGDVNKKTLLTEDSSVSVGLTSDNGLLKMYIYGHIGKGTTGGKHWTYFCYSTNNTLGQHPGWS